MLPGNPSVLTCIFAHPDDEAFGPGGTIAKYAQLIPVHLLCVTNGDGGNGHPGDKKLGEIRRQELLNATAVLRVPTVQFLNFADGSLCNNNYHQVAQALRAYLDQVKPDTLMTFDSNGISGHLDHIALSMITSYLFEKLDYVKTLLYFTEGEDIKEIIGKDYFVYVPPGRRQNEINFTVDVSDVFATKLQAMRQHLSQKKDCDWIINRKGDSLKKEKFIVLTKS